VEPGCPLAVFAGRLEPMKNLERLIEALALVMQRQRLTVVFCGDGSMRWKLEEQSRRLGIADRLHFAGNIPVDDVWSLMKRADVFTFVSEVEGLPNAVMEAMACGAPLLVSDIPAHRDFLDERSARFAAPDDIQAIADGICKVLSQPRHQSQLAQAAREEAERWSISELAKQYDRIYEQVCRK
jgi:glycosyltransferase involved in cell wall biosynthesis